MSMAYRIAIGIVAGLLVFFAGFAAGNLWSTVNQAMLSPDAVKSQISAYSDLATVKVRYNGEVRYEAGSIPLIDERGFTMVYAADVHAGVNLNESTVEVAGRHITITLPQANVQSIAIDPESLELRDSNWTLLNRGNRDDVSEALRLAEEDVRGKIDRAELLESANTQAEEVVRGLLSPFVDQGYTLTVNRI